MGEGGQEKGDGGQEKGDKSRGDRRRGRRILSAQLSMNLRV